MEVGKHRKYLIRTFFKNYLELNRTEAEERETVESIRNGVEFKGGESVDSDIRDIHSVFGTECQFYGRDYRCHADFSTDGADYGGGPVCGVE